MKFQKVRIVGQSNVDLALIGAQSADPFVLKTAEGLGPTEIDVFIKGGVYQGSKPQNREITLLVTLNPDYNTGQTSEELRELLYPLMSPMAGTALQIQLLKYNSVEPMAWTEGYVKRMEPNLFSKDPEVQITISCTSAHFVGATVNIDTIPFGAGFNFPALPNVGSAQTGFFTSLTFQQTAYLFTLEHYGTNGVQKVYVEGTFAANSSIVIDTNVGSKGVWLDVPGQPRKNIMAQVHKDNKWILLNPGANRLVTNTIMVMNWLYYTPKYKGV